MSYELEVFSDKYRAPGRFSRDVPGFSEVKPISNSRVAIVAPRSISVLPDRELRAECFQRKALPFNAPVIAPVRLCRRTLQ